MLLIAMWRLMAGPVAADETREARAMLEEAELVRAKAETARQEAARAAERAISIAERQAREARQAAEGTSRQHEEVAMAREELSRAHNELREASREVARAHRELSRSGQDREVMIDVNLGDRAVIGVVLGGQSPRGVQLMGVSPDGPAERAGLQPGDIVTSIQGNDLVNNNEARQVAFAAVRGIRDGEDVTLVAERDGQAREYTVTAEQREPRGWQSVMRFPDAPVIPEGPDGPDSAYQIVETITIPEIDQAELAAEIAELTERIESREFTFVGEDGETLSQFAFEDFSDMGGWAMSDAHIWFGLPQAHGL
jgi:C-terminal processing protease CtpA/Prc